MGFRWCIGYGSLIDQNSAKKTCSKIKNFQIIKINKFKRIFGKIDPWATHNDLLDWSTKEVADAYLLPDEDFTLPMMASLFEVPIKEWRSFQERECQYYEHSETINIDSKEIEATIFMGFESEEDFRKSCSPQYKLWPTFKDKYNGDVYRQDIFPSTAYLNQCLEAYKSLGKESLDNFLDTSFLADKTTSLRTYLKQKNTT